MAKVPIDPRKQLLKDEANKLSAHLDADLIVLNFEIMVPIDFIFLETVAKRKPRTNVLMFLTTEGGNADSAFRMMRFLQTRYANVGIVVCGWCKSAGTLMCIGAHDLYIGPGGELGPLDVQIAKADEMDEQKSGLVAEAAFEKLQQEAFKFFMSFVRDIGGSEYRVTLKTAADIATRMAIGVIQPIFDKFDPVTIGEDYRSNRLAQAYAERLNVHSKNLVRSRQLDALENLLSSYPSHGFVIDAKEAKSLFANVHPISPEIDAIVSLLGNDAKLPRNRRQGQGPRLEFLNDDPQSSPQVHPAPVAPSPPAPGTVVRRPARNRNGTRKRPGDPAKRSGKEPIAIANDPDETKS